MPLSHGFPMSLLFHVFFHIRGTESRPNARDVVVEGVDVAIHQGIVAADREGLAQQGECAQHVLARTCCKGKGNRCPKKHGTRDVQSGNDQQKRIKHVV